MGFIARTSSSTYKNAEMVKLVESKMLTVSIFKNSKYIKYLLFFMNSEKII